METTDKIINVALLAYGMSGKIFHAPFLHLHPGFNLIGVTERNHKKAQQDYPALISYNSVEELLNDKLIDLVVINTPNNLHYQHTKAALEKGKHVLIEKPFVATTQQAKELFQLADRQNKQILFYQNRRWDSDFITVKQTIQSGKLGKLNEIHIRFDRYRPELSPKEFKETPTEASGLLYDLGPHLLDQIISLFGRPLNYNKILGKNRPNTQVDDYFHIQLSYPDNLAVTVASSLLVANPQPAFILHGTKGSFIKPRADVQEEQLGAGMKPNDTDFGIEPLDKEGILTTINQQGEKTDYAIQSAAGNYIGIFEAVYQTLAHQKPYPITREEIIIQLEIMEK